MQLQERTYFGESNRYYLETLLGRGGFSEVWLVKDSITDMELVLKIYAPGTGMNGDGLKIFSKELANVYNLSHKNLLKPQHVDSWQGMPYLVMSYCPKGSLVTRIGKLNEAEIYKIIRDVSSGLAYLHECGIIHQDIKPDNILIDEAGNYVITDFGISTRARSTLRKSVAGSTANSGGTIAYMGPERFEKEPMPIKASDIWSLGAMLYELMTGEMPFGEHGGLIQKSGAEVPIIIGDYSDELKQLVEKMLSLEPWDRPTAVQLLSGKSVTPTPLIKEPSMIEDSPKMDAQPIERRMWIWIILSLVICAGGGMWYYSNQETQRKEQIALDVRLAEEVAAKERAAAETARLEKDREEAEKERVEKGKRERLENEQKRLQEENRRLAAELEAKKKIEEDVRRMEAETARQNQQKQAAPTSKYKRYSKDGLSFTYPINYTIESGKNAEGYNQVSCNVNGSDLALLHITYYSMASFSSLDSDVIESICKQSLKVTTDALDGQAGYSDINVGPITKTKLSGANAWKCDFTVKVLVVPCSGMAYMTIKDDMIVVLVIQTQSKQYENEILEIVNSIQF